MGRLVPSAPCPFCSAAVAECRCPGAPLHERIASFERAIDLLNGRVNADAAELARLRAALEKIAAGTWMSPAVVSSVEKFAREALAKP